MDTINPTNTTAIYDNGIDACIEVPAGTTTSSPPVSETGKITMTEIARPNYTKLSASDNYPYEFRPSLNSQTPPQSNDKLAERVKQLEHQRQVASVAGIFQKGSGTISSAASKPGKPGSKTIDIRKMCDNTYSTSHKKVKA